MTPSYLSEKEGRRSATKTTLRRSFIPSLWKEQSKPILNRRGRRGGKIYAITKVPSFLVVLRVVNIR
jgi:hypothetical protein